MNVTLPLKIASGVVTVLALGVTVAIGGGHPVAPARVADGMNGAAENIRQAASNTERAARSTEGLATIAENVESQVRSSRRLLDIQLRLEESSRRGSERSEDLQAGIGTVRTALIGLERRLRALAGLTASTTRAAESASDAGAAVEATLEQLRRRFNVVVRESRELNRKARGYQELRDGPG